MNKFEYNIKVEKMKKLVDNRDFETAAQIADTVNWKKVKDTRMLSTASMIYERNRRYADAKNILMFLYKSRAGGRRLIYKLAELSAKEQKFDDAEMFYRKYKSLVPGSLSVYTLRYEILSAQNAPLTQQIEILETYMAGEYDEKWSYELARLYYKAGRREDCVKLCDDIILWFSVGPYVERAARLKAVFEPLTPIQEDKVQNQDKYEKYLRQVAKECEIQAEKKFVRAQAGKEASKEAEAQIAATVVEGEETVSDIEQEKKGNRSVMNRESGMGYEENEGMKNNLAREAEQMETILEQEPETGRKETEEKCQETDEESNAGEMRFAQKRRERQWENDVEEIISNFNRELNAGAEGEAQEKNESGMVQGLLYVSAPGKDRGMEYATEAIKELRRIEGKTANKVARITGAKLNLLGFGDSVSKLNGADLIIMEASQLSSMTLMEILRITQREPLDNIIVFVDTPEGIERLDVRAKETMVEVLYRLEQEERARKEAYRIQIRPVMMPEKSLVEAKFAMEEQAAAAIEPDLLDLDSQIPDPVVRHISEDSPHSGFNRISRSQQYPEPFGIDPEKIRENLVSMAETICQNEEISRTPASADQPGEPYRDGAAKLSAPAFVAKIKEYAEDLDCVIEEIAGLAIYALADQYSEAGEPLSDELARQVTEAAVIRAEKRRLGGLFSSKYDKEGRLILKEAHFKL